MARKNDITCAGFIEGKNGELIPLESLPKEKMDQLMAYWSSNLSAVMSAYYTQHPEEHIALVKRERPPMQPGG